jgi:hypothetical protein
MTRYRRGSRSRLAPLENPPAEDPLVLAIGVREIRRVLRHQRPRAPIAEQDRPGRIRHVAELVRINRHRVGPRECADGTHPRRIGPRATGRGANRVDREPFAVAPAGERRRVAAVTGIGVEVRREPELPTRGSHASATTSRRSIVPSSVVPTTDTTASTGVRLAAQCASRSASASGSIRAARIRGTQVEQRPERLLAQVGLRAVSEIGQDRHAEVARGERDRHREVPHPAGDPERLHVGELRRRLELQPRRDRRGLGDDVVRV